MKLKSVLFYLFIIGGGATLGYWIILHGKSLESVATVVEGTAEESAWQHFVEAIGANLVYPLAMLLFQIIAIILVARFFGILFRKSGNRPL